MGRRPESISKSRSVLEAKVLGETKGKKNTLGKKKNYKKKIKKEVKRKWPRKSSLLFP